MLQSYIIQSFDSNCKSIEYLQYNEENDNKLVNWKRDYNHSL